MNNGVKRGSEGAVGARDLQLLSLSLPFLSVSTSLPAYHVLVQSALVQRVLVTTDPPPGTSNSGRTRRATRSERLHVRTSVIGYRLVGPPAGGTYFFLQIADLTLKSCMEQRRGQARWRWQLQSVAHTAGRLAWPDRDDTRQHTTTTTTTILHKLREGTGEAQARTPWHPRPCCWFASVRKNRPVASPAGLIVADCRQGSTRAAERRHASAKQRRSSNIQRPCRGLCASPFVPLASWARA